MVEIEIARDELISQEELLVEQYKITQQTGSRHFRRIRELIAFMQEHDCDIYTEKVGASFLKILELTDSKYRYTTTRGAIFLLNNFLKGLPYSPKYKEGDIYTFPGTLGIEAKSFISLRSKEYRFSDSTIQTYQSSLDSFTTAMKMHGTTLETLRREDVNYFLASSQNQTLYKCGPVRIFLKYLFESGFTKEDLSRELEGLKCHRGEKLPSFYTKDEVIKIERAVDRASEKGKRDYAMILLASRLGLRASDITRLQFASLDWDNSIITLKQHKTKREITLPLLSDIGDAIIDYVKYGRPSNDSKHLFLSLIQPYRPIKVSTLCTIVAAYLNSAGVSPKGRHHGTHSLRHSLATSLLESGTSLPVISEVLGHGSTGSTMYYLGVDIKSILECSLAVPGVPENFYTQKGGLLYA